MNLGLILNGERQTLNVDEHILVADLENEHGIRYLTPLHIKGIIRSKNNSMEMDVEISTEVSVDCARCLADVNFPIQIENKIVLMTEDQRSWDDEYDSFLIEDGELGLLDLASSEILQSLPIQPLCSEDCKGFCSGCSVNLNEEDCKCEKQTDSRFDILKELLK